MAGVLASARGEVRLQSSASNGTGAADVSYSTAAGVFGASQSGNGAYVYEPDALPGHQFFHLTAGISASATATNATADLPHGIVRADANNSGASNGNGTNLASSRAQILDTIAFNNPTGQPATITVDWKVEGSLAVTRGQTFSRASYHEDLRIDGPGLVARFLGDGHEEADPSGDFANFDATGWQTSSCEPISGGYGGVTCHGTLTIPAGDFTFSYYALVDAAASGDAPSASNFANTGALTFTIPPGVSFTSSDGTLSAGSRMVNIASRAEVLGGDSVEIAGFIVTGAVAKKIIIRGIGPSLADPPVNLSGVLMDPVLELHQTGTNGKDVTLFTNNNWKDSQQTEVQNTGVAPTKDLEAAMVQTLNPGSYTAILRGNNNSNGIGVIEVYDLQPDVDSKLANISTRAFVNAGDNVLIGGLIGGGNGSQPKVLIRAIGPSLAQLGVPNPLQDHILELHDKNGITIATNDDWQSDQKDAIQGTGAAPTNTKESAIIATLQPTNYTAIVKGANNSTGVGLVEVYHLQ